MLQIEVTAAPLPHASGTAAIAVTAFQDVTAKLQAEEQARQRIAAALSEKAEAEAALAARSAPRRTRPSDRRCRARLQQSADRRDRRARRDPAPSRRCGAPTALGEAALAAGRRGQRLTAQLLAFARRQPLQLEMRELERADPRVRAAAPTRSVTRLKLTLRLCETRRVALIDPAQFEASLLNLHRQRHRCEPAAARSSSRRKSAAGRRISRGSRTGPYFRLSVIDSGEGISAEVMKRIFEPFFTTKSPARAPGSA